MQKSSFIVKMRDDLKLIWLILPVYLTEKAVQGQWHLGGHGAIAFLRLIRPYLKEKNKVARADIVLDELAPLIGLDPRRMVGYKEHREAIAQRILAIK